MNTLQLGIDAYNGNNYVQAYSYFNIYLQEDYNNPQAHFLKGMSSAYQSTLANLNMTEMVNEYNIAVRLYRESSISEQDKNKEICNMVTKMADFIIAFYNLALNHRQKFPDLQSSYNDYWSTCIALIKTISSICGSLDYDTVRGASHSYSSFLQDVSRNINIICTDSNKSFTYKSGSHVDVNGITGGYYVASDMTKTSPPLSLQTAISVWNNSYKNLDEIISAAKQGITVEEYRDKQRIQAEENLHNERVARKIKANKHYKQSLIKAGYIMIFAVYPFIRVLIFRIIGIRIFDVLGSRVNLTFDLIFLLIMCIMSYEFRKKQPKVWLKKFNILLLVFYTFIGRYFVEELLFNPYLNINMNLVRLIETIIPTIAAVVITVKAQKEKKHDISYDETTRTYKE